MSIYVYKLTSRKCPSLWTCWAVRAESAEEAMQWQYWVDAPKCDSAILVGEILVD